MLMAQDRWGDFMRAACSGDHVPGRRQQGEVKAAAFAPEGKLGRERLAIPVNWQQALGNFGGRLGPRPRRTLIEQAKKPRCRARQHCKNDEARKQRDVNPKVKASRQLCAFANT